jgi:hypothetical protein
LPLNGSARAAASEATTAAAVARPRRIDITGTHSIAFMSVSSIPDYELLRCGSRANDRCFDGNPIFAADAPSSGTHVAQTITWQSFHSVPVLSLSYS